MSPPPSTEEVSIFTFTLRRAGRYRWVGHRDVMRAIQRILRRCGLPLWYTEGFHPHPKMSLPEPLPIGVASHGERWVAHFAGRVTLETVRAHVEPHLPEGLDLITVVEGADREAVDTPLVLRITDADPVVVVAHLAQSDVVEGLGLARVDVLEQDEEEMVVRLVPPAGRRVSVGRFAREISPDSERPAELERISSEPWEDPTLNEGLDPRAVSGSSL